MADISGVILGLQLSFVAAQRLLALLSIKATPELRHHFADLEDCRDHTLWIELGRRSPSPSLVSESSSGCTFGGSWTTRPTWIPPVVGIGVLGPVPPFRAHTPTPQLRSVSVPGCITYWASPSAGGNSLCNVMLPCGPYT